MEDIFETVRYKAGDMIFSEGSKSSDVYLIRQGAVKIVKSKDKDKTKTIDELEQKYVVLAELGFNDIFGEMSLIDNKPRSASAIAVTDVVCHVLKKEDFEKRLNMLDPFMIGLFKTLTRIVRGATKMQVEILPPEVI